MGNVTGEFQFSVMSGSPSGNTLTLSGTANGNTISGTWFLDRRNGLRWLRQLHNDEGAVCALTHEAEITKTATPGLWCQLSFSLRRSPHRDRRLRPPLKANLPI
jgi:hypothetical protein